jgi:hypothetical protein
LAALLARRLCGATEETRFALIQGATRNRGEHHPWSERGRTTSVASRDSLGRARLAQKTRLQTPYVVSYNYPDPARLGPLNCRNPWLVCIASIG